MTTDIDSGDSGAVDDGPGTADFWLKRQLGFDLETSPGHAVATIECDERHLNPHGTVHGAVLFALVDTGMGAATMTVLPDGALCATIEIHTRFLAPIFGGTVRAEVVVRATEAFTPSLPGLRRAVAPVYSLMIATEPLPEAFWERAGLRRRETFNDDRHMVIYGQRTADDRLAFGGRGAWYHWGSRVRPEFDRDDRVHRMVHETLLELFPYLGDAAVTHRWGGAVAAPRDWWCHVAFDPSSGLASAGGYVGDGVATTNLAGRTLADLITGTDSDLVSLPWVGHRSRRWEPEPLRYVGINSMVLLPAGADRYEARHGRPSRWRETIVERLTGGGH